MHCLAEKPDARRAPRFPLEQIVAVKSLDGRFDDASGTSRNVSACGVFLHLDTSPPVGSPLELFMMMPQTIGFCDASFPLRFYGAVVRVENLNGKFGVGIAFDKVEIIAEG